MSRRDLFRAASAAMLAISPARAEEHALRVTVQEVAPGVFVHAPRVALVSRANRGDIANLGFIVGDAAVAVIDTGSSLAIGRALLAAINEVTDRPVRYVINTHMHFDHVMGNAAFAGEGVTFAAHRNLQRALAARRDTYVGLLKRETGEDPLSGGEIVMPDLAVDGTTEIDLDGRRLILKAWQAAHTDNDLTVFDPQTATLFAGDLLFNAHTPVLDGSIAGWLAVAEELKAIPARQVVPGHGAAALPWPQGLEPQTRYLARLAGDIRSSIKAGVPLAEATKTAGESERGNWELFDDFNPRNATAAYGELEWE